MENILTFIDSVNWQRAFAVMILFIVAAFVLWRIWEGRLKARLCAARHIANGMIVVWGKFRPEAVADIKEMQDIYEKCFK